MLSPEQVLPFLLHEDQAVRTHAADYLADGYESTPALVPVTADHFWQSIDRYGIERSTRLLTRLRDVPQTEASFARASAVLGSSPDENTAIHLQRVFGDVDLATLEARREELLNAGYLPSEVRAHLAARLALVDVPPGELWDRLKGDSEQNTRKHLGDFDQRVADRLIEALARHGDAAAARAMALLANGPGEDWIGWYAVRLLGELRHAPAIDLLIGFIATDDDITPNTSGKALRRIGTDEVIHKVEAAWATLESEYDRMVLVDLLKGIKRPASEYALLRLIEREEDAELLASMGAGLCDLCTTDGLEAIRQLIVQDRYDEGMAELDELLLTLCKMTGFDPPEAAAWREVVAQREADRQARMKRFDGPGGAQALIQEALRRLSGRSGGLDAPKDDDEGDAGPDAEYDDRDLYDKDGIPLRGTIAPIVRDAPKVGRNDPCPCGSGKKYKKCCGK